MVFERFAFTYYIIIPIRTLFEHNHDNNNIHNGAAYIIII